jgi:hypothetical protein
MATQKQIKANRKNAQKSTGPKTAEGKAAVSKNAVKHDLFTDSVVTGETEAEYAAFHGELLAELAPRGVVELLLAERVVSLWWRLRRAERMQNQAIEDKIGRFVTNDTSRSCRKYNLRDQGIRPDDPRFDLDGLPLGRIGNEDFAVCRILDKMLLYERRIESSLNRAMKELKRFQTIRRIEWQNAAQRQNKSIYKDPFLAEAATRFSSGEDHGDLKKQSQYDRSAFSVQRAELEDLKKQSQFAADELSASLYEEDGYGNIPACKTSVNKAKRSQFDVPGPAAGIGEKVKSAKAATG